MSAFVIARMKVDPAKLRELFDRRGDDFRTVKDAARKAGAIHHRFVAGDGEVLIVDEWDTAEHFQQFFGSNEIIPTLMQDAGVAGPPEVSVYETLDSPDQF